MTSASKVLKLTDYNSIATDFLNTYRSKNTRVNYQKDICNFFNVENTNNITLKNIRGITFMNIQEFILQLIDEDKSSKTIKRNIATLKSFYNYCESRELVNNNIFNDKQIKRLLKTNLPQEEDYVGKPLSKQELAHYLNSIDNKRDLMLFKMLFSTGMRREEAVTAKFTDIKYNDIEKRWYLHVDGKGRKKRIIQMQTKMLQELIDWKGENFYEINEAMFAMDKSNVNKLCNKYNEKSGITISPHDCRRTFAVQLCEEGIHLRTIQLVLGHENIKTTEGYLRGQQNLKQGIYDIELW